MSDEAWLAATWPFVRSHLPAAPAAVLELGCGPLGGFVPRLRELGYDAVGVDPHAPDGPQYRQVEFERYDAAGPLDAVLASVSLHHVADLDAVLDRIGSMLKPAGTIVVAEWAHERFDEAAARWCFDRLAADQDGWLQHHRERWRESRHSWEDYFREFMAAELLHTGDEIVRGLQARFDTALVGDGPYFFADLDGVSSAEEEAAIAAGLISANGIHYVGRRRT